MMYKTLMFTLIMTVPSFLFAQSQDNGTSRSILPLTPTTYTVAIPTQYEWTQQKMSLVTMPTANPAFNKTYMIDEAGQAVSSDFVPAQTFVPENGRLVISGQGRGAQYIQRDSFNPYGSTEAGDALITGAVNLFIGAFKKKK